MKKIIKITVFIFVLFCNCSSMFGQEQVPKNSDSELKEALYKKYKSQAQGYDKKAFDVLFLDFFRKQKDEKVTLTKEEFYGYTIKIAAYSEKLGLLYKDQKEASQQTKQVWFDKNYSDYLLSKKH